MHASLHIYSTYSLHMFTKVLSSMVRNVRSKGVFLASKLHS